MAPRLLFCWAYSPEAQKKRYIMLTIYFFLLVLLYLLATQNFNVFMYS